MRRFEYVAPNSLEEALSVLRQRGDGVKLLAGGTDMLVQMKEAGLHPPTVVSIHNLTELRRLQFDESTGLRIGAGVDMGTIASNASVRRRYTALAEGAEVLGSFQTRNMATIGGNICNAAPSADTSPPAVVLEGVAEIARPQGTREMKVKDLWSGPGKTLLSNDEIVTAFRFPRFPPHTGSVYQRHTPRKIMDIAVVGVGVRLTLADDGSISHARIALGAVAPTVIRSEDAEEALIGQTPSDELFDRAAELAREDSRPISDVRGSSDFRRYLVGAMTKRCLGIALERAKAG
jgi:carbon-monoxide dehydrogenase medium subunit